MISMVKNNSQAFVTNETLDDAVDTLLKGMDNMLEEQKKIFATKKDIENVATKEDLKREASWLRDDINGLKAELSNTPSRKEFNELKLKVNQRLASA